MKARLIIQLQFDKLFNLIVCFVFLAGTTNRRFVYDAEEKIGKMLKLFQEHVHNKFNRYAFGFFLCELMNMVFALLSVFMTHKFLLDQYLPYGWPVYR